jgi:hypothetical protein
MAEIDQDKALAALEKLETEKARRLQAKIDSGEVVSIQTTVVVEASDESTEDAVDRHLASLPTLTTDGRPINYDLLVIVTGVPRGPHVPGQWSAPQPVSKEGSASGPSEEPVGSGEVSPTSPSQPTYVRAIVRNGTDDDPGQIIEARFVVEDGAVILRDTDDKFITSRMLLKDENPATLAKILLREHKPNEFQQPIKYKTLGLA